jgi:hypothetical protein
MKNQCHRALSWAALYSPCSSLRAWSHRRRRPAGISGSAAYQQMTKFAGEWTGTMQTRMEAQRASSIR